MQQSSAVVPSYLNACQLELYLQSRRPYLHALWRRSHRRKRGWHFCLHFLLVLAFTIGLWVPSLDTFLHPNPRLGLQPQYEKLIDPSLQLLAEAKSLADHPMQICNLQAGTLLLQLLNDRTSRARIYHSAQDSFFGLVQPEVGQESRENYLEHAICSHRGAFDQMLFGSVVHRRLSIHLHSPD